MAEDPKLTLLGKRGMLNGASTAMCKPSMNCDLEKKPGFQPTKKNMWVFTNQNFGFCSQTKQIGM
jgi:hypothetical protein